MLPIAPRCQQLHDGVSLCLQRAQSRLGEVGCDHFALRAATFCTWCKTGTTQRVPPPQRLFSQRSISERAEHSFNVITGKHEEASRQVWAPYHIRVMCRHRIGITASRRERSVTELLPWYRGTPRRGHHRARGCGGRHRRPRRHRRPSSGGGSGRPHGSGGGSCGRCARRARWRARRRGGCQLGSRR